MSNSQMGPHTRRLTVSFSDTQRHTDNSDKSSRPDALYTSASRPSNTPATPYDHLAAPKPLEVALCPPWAHRAAPAAVLVVRSDPGVIPVTLSVPEPQPSQLKELPWRELRASARWETHPPATSEQMDGGDGVCKVLPRLVSSISSADAAGPLRTTQLLFCRQTLS